MRSRKAIQITVTVCLAFHASLLTWAACSHSPVMTEVSNLAAGISHWRLGSFDRCRVNPPLFRMLSTLPLLIANPTVDWTNYQSDALIRSDTSFGRDFVHANGSRSLLFYTLARLMNIPLSCIGGLVCFKWSSDLYGGRSGLAALVLWCFCPSILGNAALVMPDVPAASMALASGYAFWRWSRSPGWRSCVIAGLFLGLANLGKMTLCVLFVVWPLAWLLSRCNPRFRNAGRARPCREFLMVAAQGLIAIYLINVAYAFEGTCKALGEYRFVAAFRRARIYCIYAHGTSHIRRQGLFTSRLLRLSIRACSIFSFVSRRVALMNSSRPNPIRGQPADMPAGTQSMSTF